MNFVKPLSYQRILYYRLTAMWLLSEAVAGGIMHAVNIPFSGMVISGLAVICICLIGYFVPQRGAILEATVIVMIGKWLLGPHTPPLAYLAVLFQGVAGQLVFLGMKNPKLACIFLGTLALIESAMQRIIIMVLHNGTAFWKAVNEFFRNLLGAYSTTNIFWWLVVSYFLIHAIVGVLIGLAASGIINQSGQSEKNRQYLLPDEAQTGSDSFQPRPKKRFRIRTIFFIAWLVGVLLFFQSLFRIGTPVLPAGKAFQIMLRPALILAGWYFVISPLISRWRRARLEKQQDNSEDNPQEAPLLLPSSGYIFTKSWQKSAERKGLSRLSLFWKIMITNLLVTAKPT